MFAHFDKKMTSLLCLVSVSSPIIILLIQEFARVDTPFLAPYDPAMYREVPDELYYYRQRIENKAG